MKIQRNKKEKNELREILNQEEKGEQRRQRQQETN